jgi:imidazolonepropionase-like amidohydrolase
MVSTRVPEAEGAVSLAIQGARLLPSPDADPIDPGTVVARDGQIVGVGSSVPIPPDARVIPGEGRVVTAGFWNAHVHFTEPKWKSAARAPPSVLAGSLREMLTSHGFTSVVDTGSDPRSTIALRRRIDSGEVPGPTILTAGSGLYPPRGIPYYARDSIPFWIRPLIPTPSTPRSAERAVARNIAWGADLLKLFTGSYVARGRVKTMPEAIARAAVGVAHAHRQQVFSHPSNLEGTRVAFDSGVDVLAHPPDSGETVDLGLIRGMVNRGMGLIPTLKMFATTVGSDPAYLDPIDGFVREFHRQGGQLLFGTDVGFMTDYDPRDEFRALERCGLDARAILRMLTVAPARRFGRGTGTLSVGSPGDLVILGGDPAVDVGAYAKVVGVVRRGRLLHLQS